jgi:hypothetical protein
MMGSDPRPEVHWLAFQYVCGELPADDAAAFERRLEDDQAAREAVAEAVGLTEAVTFLSPAMATPRRPARYALGWMAAGAAACLAVVLCARTMPALAPGPQAPIRKPGGEADRALARTWLKLHEDAEAAASEPADDVFGLDEPTMLAEAEPAPGGEPDGMADMPPWLLEAASLRNAEPARPAVQEN